MHKVNLKEAQTQLAELIEEAANDIYRISRTRSLKLMNSFIKENY